MLDTIKLSKLMEERKIRSYRELAKKTGIKETTLYNMLDASNMMVSNLIQLAKYFNVPVDELLTTKRTLVICNENEYKTIEDKEICNNLYFMV